jgi:hypothetical protein
VKLCLCLELNQESPLGSVAAYACVPYGIRALDEQKHMKPDARSAAGFTRYLHIPRRALLFRLHTSGHQMPSHLLAGYVGALQ